MVYKRRILYSYVIVLVGVIVVNNLLLFSAIYRRELDIKSGYILGTTTQLQSTMDYLLNKIRTDIVYLSNRAEIRDLAEWYRTSDYREKRNFFRDFDPFGRLSDVYDEAFLVHPRSGIMLDLKNKLVSPIEGSRQETMVNALTRTIEQYSGEQDLLLSLPLSGEQRTYLLRSMINQDTGERFYFFVQFNEQFFEQLLDDVFMTDDSFVVILNERDEPVHFRFRTSRLDDARVQELVAGTDAFDDATETVAAGHDRFLVAHSRSPETGWTYFYGISFQTMRAEIFSLLVIFASLALTLLALFLVVAFFVTRSLYRPVRNVMDLLGNTEDQLDADEFRSIQGHIRDLIDNNRTLETALVAGNDFERESFLVDLVRTRAIDPKAAGERIARYSMDILAEGSARYRVAICKVKGSAEITHPQVRRTQRVGKESTFIQWFHLPAELHFEAFSTEDSIVVFIVSIPTDGTPAGSSIADLATIDEQIADSMTVGESSLLSSLGDLPRGYQEARVALEYRALVRTTVIPYREVEEYRGRSYFYPYDEEERLVTALKRRDPDAVFEHFDRFFEIVVASGVAFHNLRHVCFHFLDRLLHLIKTFDLPMDAISPAGEADPWDVLEAADDVETMRHTLRGLVEKLIELVESNQTSATFRIATAVRSMIEKSYTDRNLNLDQIADEMRYSVSHVSAIFKNHYGETIKNYITTLRLERAKELLVTTDTKISAVGRETGYDNVGSFVKIFKAYLGETPKEFRLRNRPAP